MSTTLQKRKKNQFDDIEDLFVAFHEKSTELEAVQP